MLAEYQERMEAIVYCPREGTPDIYDQLKRSALVTIQSITPKALHQRPSLELKTLTIVLAHKNNLRSLITQSRPKQHSKRRRKTLRTRHAIEEAKLTQTFENLNVTWSCIVVGVYPQTGGVT